MTREIAERLLNLEKILAKYEDVIADDAKTLRQEYAVISAEKLDQLISEREKEERLLTIGIIGKVNAGKSSILNSVFFDGKPVLPKAATPMTAALSVLTHGETFSATVHYFTPGDLAVIKTGHKSYEDKFGRLVEEKKKEDEGRLKRRGEPVDPIQIEKGAKIKAAQELADTSYGVCHDQYERMLKTGGHPEVICTNESRRIDAEDEDSLMKKLNEYVGSEGKFMPFTNYVEICLPYDSLRDIRVVDTPGINDPVRSREERTMEYLRECDAAFVISPAGQFLAAETTELMDRVSGKEGISELFLIASQTDSELYASEFKKAGGEFEKKQSEDGNSVVSIKKTADLNIAKESIRESCFQSVFRWLGELKRNNPETERQFDQLIKDGKERFIAVSSICSAMGASFYKRDEAWDRDMKFVWGKLTQHYADYFSEGESGKANLENLGNIGKIREKIEFTRSRKIEIMRKKQDDYLNQQNANIENYRLEVLKAGKEKYNAVKNGDVQQLQAEKQNLEKKFYMGAGMIDDAFDACFEDFRQTALSESSRGISGMIKSTRLDVDGIKDSKTITETVDKKGILPWVARLFGIGGAETRSRELVTIRTGAVQSKISALVNDLQIKLENSLENAKTQWRKNLQRKVAEAYGKVFEDDVTTDTDKLRHALRNVLNSMDIPVFDFSDLAFRGALSGTLKGDDAVYDFLDSIAEYLAALDAKYRKQTKDVLEVIEKQIKKERISDLIFKDIEKQIGEIESILEQKVYFMERLEKCIAELEAL
jgi:GTPase Era involved in 16S rRNA processing